MSRHNQWRMKVAPSTGAYRESRVTTPDAAGGHHREIPAGSYPAEPPRHYLHASHPNGLANRVWLGGRGLNQRVSRPELCQQGEGRIADEGLAVRGGPFDGPAIEVDAARMQRADLQRVEQVAVLLEPRPHRARDGVERMRRDDERVGGGLEGAEIVERADLLRLARHVDQQ